jgi:hypothetical protein
LLIGNGAKILQDKKRQNRNSTLNAPDRLNHLEIELEKLGKEVGSLQSDFKSTVTTLNESLQKTKEQMATLQGGLSAVRSMCNIGGPVLLTACLTGIGFLISQASDIKALKQKLSDSGLGSIVALSGPGLQKNLNLVAAQVQIARSAGKKATTPNSGKAAKALSTSIATVANQHPDVPQVWNAAAQLISYRSDLQTDFRQDSQSSCLTPHVSGGDVSASAGPDKNGSEALTIELKDCTLVLDDVDAFSRSQVEYGYEHVLMSRIPLVRILDLDHVTVVYKGGPIIPVSQIVFHQCSLDFQIPPGNLSVPPAPARQLMQNLLAADFSQSVKITTG